MSVQNEIEKILSEKFSPVHLEVINESHKHKGHAGDDGSGESHFKVIIASEQFNDKNRVTRSRMVYQALDDLIKGKIHALSVTAMMVEKLP